MTDSHDAPTGPLPAQASDTAPEGFSAKPLAELTAGQLPTGQDFPPAPPASQIAAAEVPLVEKAQIHEGAHPEPGEDPLLEVPHDPATCEGCQLELAFYRGRADENRKDMLEKLELVRKALEDPNRLPQALLIGLVTRPNEPSEDENLKAAIVGSRRHLNKAHQEIAKELQHQMSVDTAEPGADMTTIHVKGPQPPQPVDERLVTRVESGDLAINYHSRAILRLQTAATILGGMWASRDDWQGNEITVEGIRRTMRDTAIEQADLLLEACLGPAPETTTEPVGVESTDGD
jgi:hypothetical protein